MNVQEVMEGLGSRLETISGLRVAAYPADQVNPPQALVNFPEEMDDATMGDGSTRAIFPVHLLLDGQNIRSATANLQPYISDTGSQSIKAAIQGDITLGGAVDSADVIGRIVEYITVGSTDYLAATFRVDVIA